MVIRVEHEGQAGWRRGNVITLDSGEVIDLHAQAQAERSLNRKIADIKSELLKTVKIEKDDLSDIKPLDTTSLRDKASDIVARTRENVELERLNYLRVYSSRATATEIKIDMLTGVGLTREQALKVMDRDGFLTRDEARLNLWKLTEVEAPLRIESLIANNFSSKKRNDALKSIETNDSSMDGKIYDGFYLRFVKESVLFEDGHGNWRKNPPHYRTYIIDTELV